MAQLIECWTRTLVCVGLNPEDWSILLCYARMLNVVSLFCFRCVHLLYLSLICIYIYNVLSLCIPAPTHTVHTYCNIEMEREERSRELPFRAERQSQEEKRRREELQQRVVEAERRAQEESRRADRAQQRAREMEGRVREESRHVAGAAQLTSPNTHIERKRLKGLFLCPLKNNQA